MIPFARIITYGNEIKIISVKKFMMNTNGYIMLSDDGKLYAKGTQSAGQFGLGNGTELTAKTLIQENVSDFWFCDVGMIIYKTDGSYWFSGSAAPFGYTQSLFVNVSTTIGTQISTSKKFYFTRGGGMMVITADDNVQVLGSNTYGTIGLASTTTTVQTWTTLTAMAGTESILLGALSACAKKINGEIWFWGENRFNCYTSSLGTGYSVPFKIFEAGIIKDYMITTNFGFYYTNSTSAYFRGYMPYTNLGVPATNYSTAYNIYTNTQPKPFNPSTFKFLKPIIPYIIDGQNMPVYVDYDGSGEVYTSGFNSQGSLGVDLTATTVTAITKVPVPEGMSISAIGYGQQTNRTALINGSMYISGNLRYINEPSSAGNDAVYKFQPLLLT